MTIHRLLPQAQAYGHQLGLLLRSEATSRPTTTRPLFTYDDPLALEGFRI